LVCNPAQTKRENLTASGEARKELSSNIVHPASQNMEKELLKAKQIEENQEMPIAYQLISMTC
jgi:hypothetical protein